MFGSLNNMAMGILYILSAMPLSFVGLFRLSPEKRHRFALEFMIVTVGGLACGAFHIRSWFALIGGSGNFWDFIILLASGILMAKAVRRVDRRWDAYRLAGSILLWSLLLGTVAGLTTT